MRNAGRLPLLSPSDMAFESDSRTTSTPMMNGRSSRRTSGSSAVSMSEASSMSVRCWAALNFEHSSASSPLPDRCFSRSHVLRTRLGVVLPHEGAFMTRRPRRDTVGSEEFPPFRNELRPLEHFVVDDAGVLRVRLKKPRSPFAIDAHIPADQPEVGNCCMKRTAEVGRSRERRD